MPAVSVAVPPLQPAIPYPTAMETALKNPPRSYRSLVWPVVLSFVFCAAVIVLRMGIGATPYETTDSLGRAMGFNDPLYGEHYRIMVGNFRVGGLFSVECFYEWVLIGMHVVGAGLLLSQRVAAKVTKCFFLLQAVVFPIGLIAMPLMPLIVGGFFLGAPMDREGFEDIPFIMMVAQPMWVAVSLFIGFRMRGEKLGVKALFRRLADACKEHGEATKRA